MTQVKLMGAFPDYVGAHGHVFAPMIARPSFRSAQQKSTRPAAAFVVGHYQRIDFGAKLHFEQRRDAGV